MERITSFFFGSARATVGTIISGISIFLVGWFFLSGTAHAWWEAFAAFFNALVDNGVPLLVMTLIVLVAWKKMFGGAKKGK
jgi:hypothetical protein